MSEKLNKAYRYAAKIVEECDKAIAEMVEQRDNKSQSFSFWISWKFQGMISCESCRDRWQNVKKFLESAIADNMTDEKVVEYLLGYRTELVGQILQKTNSNSTNPISNEIERIQEDELKKFVGYFLMSRNSLADMLYNVFGVNVRI